MYEKLHYPEGFEELLNKIENDELVAEYSKRVGHNEVLKKQYEERYHKQIDSYNLHARKFGKVERPQTPAHYNQQLDADLIKDMEQTVQQQEEEKRKENKQEETELTAEQQKMKDKADKVVQGHQVKEGIAENKDDIEKSGKDNKKKEEKTDPRILAFRERMKEMDQENEMHKNKGIEYD